MAIQIDMIGMVRDLVRVGVLSHRFRSGWRSRSDGHPRVAIRVDQIGWWPTLGAQSVITSCAGYSHPGGNLSGWFGCAAYTGYHTRTGYLHKGANLNGPFHSPIHMCYSPIVTQPRLPCTIGWPN